MSIVEKITNEIKKTLEITAPPLTKDQIERRDKILNSDNPNFKGYGHKISEIEKIVKNIKNKYECTYQDAIEVFKNLISSDIHEEKFTGVFFLNLFKKDFDKSTIDMFYNELREYCDTWAICDSTIIRVIGPFLSKKGNGNLAKETIENWSNSEDIWIRRASIVILLKIIMIKKELNTKNVFEFIEKMLKYTEEYIQKGIGWLLKTCSRYEADLVFKYLNENKNKLPRLILRYGSEKLTKEQRDQILKKR